MDNDYIFNNVINIKKQNDIITANIIGSGNASY
jgi:hypothetical protein